MQVVVYQEPASFELDTIHCILNLIVAITYHKRVPSKILLLISSGGPVDAVEETSIICSSEAF